MATHRVAETLVGCIYDAAVDPVLWSDAIGRIVEATHCRSGVLYEHDMATQQSRPLGFHRFDDTFMRDYECHYAALDPWNRRARAWPVGVVAPTYALISDDEFRRSEFYQDHLRLTGLFYGLGGVVERAGGRMAVFGVQCAYEDGRFSPEATALIGRLMPHIGRAYRMQTVLGRARRDRETLEDVLHLLEKPVLIVEPDGRLVFANHAAENLLESADGLALARGRIAAAHRDDRAALTCALRPANPDDAPSAIALRRRTPQNERHPRPPLVVIAVPLPQGAVAGGRSGRIALLVETRDHRPHGLGDLTAAFHLSAAETRLWSALVDGATLAEIAAETEVSVNTLRVQLAALFRKVGVHRQADLVRLALEFQTASG